jgi:hypothetical protein
VTQYFRLAKHENQAVVGKISKESYMATGRYRVVMNGFRCNTETLDDMMQFDGKRDEVFISYSIRCLDKNGQMIGREKTGQSPIMGDTLNQPNRIGAGSASTNGGIRTGDGFPSASPWIRSIPLSSARDYPPMVLWEGELTQGENVVFITPTIWEWDDAASQNLVEGGLQWLNDTDAQFGAKAKTIVTGVYPVAGPVFDAVSLGIKTANTLFGVSGPIGNSGSRPIGFEQDLDKDPNGKAFSFRPKVVALTRDVAEALIAQGSFDADKGRVDVIYSEHKHFQGNYTLYLQVERVNVPSQAVIGIGESLGGGLTSGPTACSWGQGRLDVFVRGADNALHHKWYDGSWSDWESLGGGLTSNPAAASWGQGRLDVFVRGADNALHHKWYDGGWSGWESLGGGLTSGPAVASWGQGRLDVFVRGADNALHHKWYDGGWNNWESLGGLLTSDPGAASWGANRIDVFARGGDDALWHKFWDGDWKP